MVTTAGSTRVGSPRSGMAAVAWDATWSGFQKVISEVQALLLLMAGGLLTDLEAAAIGVGFLVGLALLRVRNGMFGRSSWHCSTWTS